MLRLGHIRLRLNLPRLAARALVAATLVVGGAVLVLPPMVIAEEPLVLEHEVKAAMLYKFLGYMEWPETAFANEDSPYRIWFLGANQVEKELRRIADGHTVNGRPIKVLKVRDLRRVKTAHILFVGESAEKHLDAAARLAKQRAFLVVTENEAGLKSGSAINLRLIDGRVGFDISLLRANEQDVKMSSRLLSLAASVEREEL